MKNYCALEHLGISTIIMMFTYMIEMVLTVSFKLVVVASGMQVDPESAMYVINTMYAVPAAIWAVYNIYVMMLESAGKIEL